MSHPPSAEGIVLVDFDGTIVAWGSLRNPVLLPMAGSAVRALKGEGYTIGIFTSRLSPTWHRAEGRDPDVGILEQVQIIEQFLFDNEIPHDFITAEKVPAVLYLDDKAMRVNEARNLNDAVDAFLARGDEAI
jgi:hypothetical protein